jgi:hypothetical protein
MPTENPTSPGHLRQSFRRAVQRDGGYSLAAAPHTVFTINRETT